MKLDTTGKRTEIFDGKVGVLHTGKEFGTVHPQDPQFAVQFERLLQETGQAMVLAQKLAFNTKVTPINDLSEL